MKIRGLAKLKKAAKAAAAKAYCPYSQVHVGAALLTAAGKLYSGCNIENLSYGATVCAERTALWTAVVAGERNFAVIYLYTREQWSPCGQCLQVMSEFLEPTTPVVLGSDTKESVLQLKDLLPQATSKATYHRLRSK